MARRAGVAQLEELKAIRPSLAYIQTTYPFDSDADRERFETVLWSWCRALPATVIRNQERAERRFGAE